LWCWIAVYLVFFTFSSTKLPNYILPIYAPIAILTARFLERWRTGVIQIPSWVLNLCLACLALVGLTAGVGLLVAGGSIDVPKLNGRQLHGLETWAVLGLLPVLGALAGWWCAHRQYRTGFMASVAMTAIIFVGTLFAGGAVSLDKHKAPRILVETAHAQQTHAEVRVGAFAYFQPSLVFYCRREVTRLESEGQALEFFRTPLPIYLFLPAAVWETLAPKVEGPYQVLGCQRDLYRHCDVLVVTNR
jgi:hypothetical protein